jgi:hypothetical protein
MKELIIIALVSLVLSSCKHDKIYEVYVNDKYVKDIYHSSFTKKNCTRVVNDYYCQNIVFKYKESD